MVNLKSRYYSKKEFISDFLDYCKGIKKEYGECPGKYFRYKMIGIEKEVWIFNISIEHGKLFLQPSLLLSFNFISYPKTQWNNLYKDTPYEDSLKTFLNREIMKGDEVNEST